MVTDPDTLVNRPFFAARSILPLGTFAAPGSSTVSATTTADPAPLARVPGVHDLAVTDGRLTFGVDDAALPRVLPVLADLHARHLTVTPPSLEELFLRHYGEDLVPENAGGPQ